jgi:hypothetical protein
MSLVPAFGAYFTVLLCHFPMGEDKLKLGKGTKGLDMHQPCAMGQI